MSRTLQSERLTLKPVEADDVDVAIEMFTNPAVTRFVGGVMSEADVLKEMPTWTRRGGDGCIGIWCLSNRNTGEKYGSVFLLPIPLEGEDNDWNEVVPGVMPAGDIEIGYVLKQSAWDQGFATEACRRLLRFAFEETPLEEVVAVFDDENEASKRVLAKAGLICRGRRRAYSTDCPDWRITRDEWMAMKRAEE